MAERNIDEELRILFNQPENPEDEVEEAGGAESGEFWYEPATTVAPELLYAHLEGEGLLRLPLTLKQFIHVSESEQWDPQFWGSWRSKQVRLVRDLSCSNSIQYNTVVTSIQEADPSAEVWVSRLWDGIMVSPNIGFGSLLEGFDGVYHAGIEVGVSAVQVEDQQEASTSQTLSGGLSPAVNRQEVAASEQHLGVTLGTVVNRPDDIESRVDVLQRSIAEKQEAVFGQVLNQIEGKIDACADVARGTRESLFKEVSERLVEVQKVCSAAPEKIRADVNDIHKQLDAKAMALEQQAVLLNGALGEQRKMLEEARGAASVQPEMSLVMAELDGKMKTYADTVRSSQLAALRDQEWENRAREERCRNIVGLSETEGEDSMELILKFFKDDLRVTDPEVEFVSRVERRDKVETWEFNGEACVEIPGFMRVAIVWNKKRFQKERGFGGLAVWCRNRLGIKVTVEHVDPRNQFICVQLHDGRSKGFLIFTYFAPLGSPAYEALETGADPLFNLTQKICRWNEMGPIWLARDFNSRSMSMQGEAVQEPGRELWRQDGSSEVWERESEDEGRNNMTFSSRTLLTLADLQS
ncbi:hypothetical protein R1sor_018038 [Riccia sorocarpa]|uniref:Uncharacterized protein n=1 Tax=Riccia sorocarpa TaxID=122646 RepID=A0ABD3ICK2_9MARC